MSDYAVKDVKESWRWLGHEGFTELVALHPEYRPGKENFEWNLKQGAFPRILYTKSEEEVVRFVEKYHGQRMVCYSLNDRPMIFKNEKGYARSATEKEIKASRNLVFDFDFRNDKVTKAQVEAFEKFLSTPAQDYFSDLGLKSPAEAYTGRGFHLLFAYPAILVEGCADIAARLRKFCADFGDDFHKELEGLEAKLDNTQDLRRVVKIYGTAKPNVGICSRWHGSERVEDEELRNHLLVMKLEYGSEKQRMNEPAFGPKLVTINGELPQLFMTLLRQDQKLRELWEGKGKAEDADSSGSGYDFSLARRLLAYGYSDVSEIATILALRPNGSFQNHHKSEDYLRRTIAKALMS